MKVWRKKYSFRLTDEDEKIGRLINGSNKSNSETIRELLRFAASELENKGKHGITEKNLLSIESKLQDIKERQENNHTELMNKLSEGVNVSHLQDAETKEDDEVDESIKNSIDSMIDMFSID